MHHVGIQVVTACNGGNGCARLLTGSDNACFKLRGVPTSDGCLVGSAYLSHRGVRLKISGHFARASGQHQDGFTGRLQFSANPISTKKTFSWFAS